MNSNLINKRVSNLTDSLILGEDGLLSVPESDSDSVSMKLPDFAQSPDFQAWVEPALWQGIDVAPLQEAWEKGEAVLRAIEMRQAAEIDGTNGVFSAETHTTAPAQENLIQNDLDLDATDQVLLVEIGYPADIQINEVDAPGDEGVIFPADIMDERLNGPMFQALQLEDDTTNISLDGQVFQAALSTEWQEIPGKSAVVTAFKEKVSGVPTSGPYPVKIWEYGDNHFDKQNTVVLFHGWLGPLKSATDFPTPSSHNGIEKLAENLSKTNEQVLFFDWVSAAEDPITLPPNNAAGRIQPVAATAKTLLQGLPSPTILIGHSLGSYMAAETLDLLKAAGAKIELVALDPAFPATGYDLDLQTVDFPWDKGNKIDPFNTSADYSLAFVVSDKHGSLASAGDNDQAGTADCSFVVDFPEGALVGFPPDVVVRLHNLIIPIYGDLIRYLDPSSNSYHRLFNSFPKNQYDNLGTETTGKHEGVVHPKDLDVTKISSIEGLNQSVYFVDQGEPDPQLSYPDESQGRWTKIVSLRDFTLDFYSEELILGGKENIKGTGNLLDNWFTGNSRNNSFDGGDGIDTVIFTDDKKNYDISSSSDNKTITITHARGTEVDGTDTLTNIEFAEFAGKKYSLPDLKIAVFSNGLQGVFEQIQLAFNEQVLQGQGLSNSAANTSTASLSAASALSADITNDNVGLPFFGDILVNTLAGHFIEDFGQEIIDYFTGQFVDELVPAEEIQTALFNVFSPLGILKDTNSDGSITTDDVVYARTGNIFQFNFDLGGRNTFAVDLPPQIGLPQLGLQLGDNAQAGVNLDYTFDFGFGVDADTGQFFFDTSPDQDLSISFTPTLTELTATIGFLQVDATDLGTNLQFGINLDDGNDNHLTLDELDNLTVTPVGTADIDLNLLSSISGQAALPKIGTDLNLHWDFIEGGPAPELSFDNTTVYLGSFLTSFVKPIIEPIQQIVQPIEQTISFLTEPIGLLRDLNLGGVNHDLLGLAKQFSPGNPTLQNVTKAIEAIQFVGDLANLVNSISGTEDIGINLGTVDLANFNLLSGDSINSATLIAPVQSLAQLEQDFQSKIGQIQNPDTASQFQSFFNDKGSLCKALHSDPYV